MVNLLIVATGETTYHILMEKTKN